MSCPPESELHVDKRNEVCHSGDLILFPFKKGFCLRKDRDVFLFFGHPHKVTDILPSMKELRIKHLRSEDSIGIQHFSKLRSLNIRRP